MITVNINDSSIEVEETTTIFQLLKTINTPLDGIAIAINNTIVSKEHWQSQQFSHNDNVLVIKASQGG